MTTCYLLPSCAKIKRNYTVHFEFCLRKKLCRKTIERLNTPFEIVIKVNPDAQMNV